MENKLDITRGILPIGAIAESLNIHQRTLRIYDKEGILVPKRSEKNRRYYSIEDFEKAKVIMFLTRNLGLNLFGVKLILALLESNNIKSKDYMSYINSIAKKAQIDIKTQEMNLKKAENKGRKSSK